MRAEEHGFGRPDRDTIQPIRADEAQVPEAQGRIEDMYRQYAPGATRLAYLLLGDASASADVVQDAFVRLFVRFRHIRNRDASWAYLRITIVNLCRDRVRKQAVERRGLERERAETARRPAWTDPPDVELRMLLIAALERMPYRQRAAVVLRYYEDLSEDETAKALRCSVRAANSLTHRALVSLREELGGIR